MPGVHHAAQGLCACAGASPPARLALLKRRLSLSEIVRMRGQFRDAVAQRAPDFRHLGQSTPPTPQPLLPRASDEHPPLRHLRGQVIVVWHNGRIHTRTRPSGRCVTSELRALIKVLRRGAPQERCNAEEKGFRHDENHRE